MTGVVIFAVALVPASDLFFGCLLFLLFHFLLGQLVLMLPGFLMLIGCFLSHNSLLVSW